MSALESAVDGVNRCREQLDNFAAGNVEESTSRGTGALQLLAKTKTRVTESMSRLDSMTGPSRFNDRSFA